MINYRFGKFGVFQNKNYEILINKFCRLIIRKDYIDDLEKKFGFKKYGDNRFILDLPCEDISSAFFVNTFCIYKHNQYEIGNDINRKVILFPGLETKKKMGLHIYDDRSIDIEYNDFIEDVEEIWEERKPIENFVFNIAPKYYIKRNGEDSSLD